jgi:ThiS family
MGKASTKKRGMEVSLVRPIEGTRTFALPQGATLGDLLREAGTSLDGAKVLVDGQQIEDVFSLKSGMTITILPAPAQVSSNGSWRDSVGTVQDTAAFREMIAAGRAIREAEREAARSQKQQNG